MAELRDKRMFTNDLYLTIVRSGMRGALGAAETVSRLARQVVRAESGRATPARADHRARRGRRQHRPRAAKIRRSTARHRPSRRRALFGALRILQHGPDLRPIAADAAAAHGNPQLRRELAPAFLQADHAGAGADRSRQPLRRHALHQGVSALFRRPACSTGCCR